MPQLALALLALTAPAQVARSFVTLPSSNGHGAVLADVAAAKVTHFRERLPATEEPELDAAGNDAWVGNQPQIVKTRNLLFDAYFGLRVAGQQRWLPGLAAPASGSGYEAAGTARGGSGLVRWAQALSGLELTTWVFAPRAMPHAGFVMLLQVKNPTGAAISGVSAFSLHNFHLGFGRPGAMASIGANGETVVVGAGREVEERGFAGAVVARPLGNATHVLAWNPTSPGGQNGYQLVQGGGATDFGDVAGNLGAADDWAHAFQFDLGTLAGGAEAWAGVAVVHHPDPFGAAAAGGWLDAWLQGRAPAQLVADERAAWAALQQSLTVPAGLSADEEHVFRQSAAMLVMAQVKESSAFLREWLSQDGQARRTRFRALDGGAAALPGIVAHRGQGAVLASLPPGEWTYAWARDGAYAAAALAALGLTAESRDALRFVLDAEGGRFQAWNELAGYSFPLYQVSLTRYTGFGVEETDFNAFGPNLEFDGFGLALWALREHERRTADTSLADARWTQVASRIGDALVALVDPSTGLLRKDSSIWETHWNGRERAWTFTNLTAVRGLCDAAAIAERRQDASRAASYRSTAASLRASIAQKLTDASGALASNREELLSGAGHFDAAVLDALALGLFDPRGRIAQATLTAMDARLRAQAGPGWARNDDRTDHAGATDLSPWGSDYDSAEWVFTDLRGAVAARLSGRAARAQALLDWTTAQAAANAGVVPETYDETTGAWKFNAPMIGFGAGAYVLALAERARASEDPACGAYFDEGQDGGAGGGGGSGGGAGGGSGGAGGGSGGGTAGAGGTGGSAGGGGGGGSDPAPCACAASPGLGLAALALLGLRARRRRG